MRYGKLNNGVVEFYPLHYITIDGRMHINPTPDVMQPLGWLPVENSPEIGTDHIEDDVIIHYTGVARTLSDAKRDKMSEIDSYDTSSEVNSFTLNGQVMWLDKATRVGVVNAAQSAKVLGMETVTFGLGGQSVTLPCDEVIALFARLEMYALECYNVTLAHKNAVESMTSIEDVDAFDVTVGYPDNLDVNI